MKMNKKMVTIALFSVLLLGACSSKKNQSASSPDYELENITFPLEEKVTLKMISQGAALAPKDPNEKLIFQRLEENLNVHVDWTNYNADFVEKLTG